jgi:hypothetical protein
MSFKRNYLSYSALKAFEKSPNHYIEYVSKEKSEPSAAMEFGSATHKWILERSKFDNEYFVAPKIDRRTKEGKELAKELAESGKTHISDGDFLRISTMDSVIKRNKWANNLVYELAESYEQEITGEIEGVPFKGYGDIIGASYVADLKTAKDADPKSFSRDSENLGYHLQAAIYSQLTGKEFYWVVIQSEAPHNCAVYWQSPEDYEASVEYLLHLICKFKEWDGMYDPEPYGNEVIALSLSPWSRIKKYSESL